MQTDCTELVGEIWEQIHEKAWEEAGKEPGLTGMLEEIVLSRSDLGQSICVRLAQRLRWETRGNDGGRFGRGCAARSGEPRGSLPLAFL